MQYIPIKEEYKQGEKVYVVSAISLKNKNKSVIQKIPHPTGNDVLQYKSIEEAKEAITRAGFSYILPDGKKELSYNKTDVSKSDNYESVILNLLRDKINSSNSNICQASILALAEFPSEETFSVIFAKLGEENEQIRKNAISVICRYGNILQSRIISALRDENWIARNSAITCIKNLCVDSNIDVEKFIQPLIVASDDTNPIVQANALTTLALAYQNYKKRK